jgi:peptide/nickel transport system ATP-binding protein
MADTFCLLSLRRLSIRSGTRQIVSGGGLKIQRGEGVALLGPSGSGKTLTAQAVLALIQTSAPGLSVEIDIDWPFRPRSELHIGYVPQETGDSLHPYLGVGRQIRDFVVGAWPDRSMQNFYYEVLELFRELRLDDPERVFAAFPHQLSGGMRQRTLIAAAVLCGPELIVLDEATSALDGLAKSAVLQCLLNLKERRGTSLLVLTHDFAEAEHLTERRFVITNQTICPQEGAFSTRSKSSILLSQISKSAEYSQNAVDMFRFKPTVFSARDVCVRASASSDHLDLGFQIANFSCLVREGEGLALVGETGCGKTTTLRGLAQLAPVTAGDVRLKDVSLNKLSPRRLREQRQRYQVVFQDTYVGLNPFLTVEELFAEPSWIFKFPPPGVAEIATILERVELDPAVKRQRCGTLSYGQRQRVAFCRAVLSFPALKLLILDEPFTALDHGSRSKTIQVLMEAMGKGLSTILASHDLDLILTVTHSIIVMRQGNVVESSSVVPWNLRDAYSRVLMETYASLRRSDLRP